MWMQVQYKPTDKSTFEIIPLNEITCLAPTTLPRLLLFYRSQIFQNPWVCFCRSVKSCSSMLMEGTQPQRGMLVYPSLPITQAMETDEILFLLYWFLCITVFFLCPWRLPNPIDRVLVLQRSTEDSLYPVIPLTLNKSSRVGGELYGKKARQGHYWKMSAFC